MKVKVGACSSDDNPVYLDVTEDVMKEINARSFRGAKPLAGNIFRWPTLDEMLKDPSVKRKLNRAFNDIPPTHLLSPSTIHCLSFGFRCLIGWASNDHVRNFAPWELETCNERQCTNGYRVLQTAPRCAPHTRFLNVDVQVRRHKTGWNITLLSLNAGQPLRAENDAKRVMYSCDHRGVPLPQHQPTLG